MRKSIFEILATPISEVVEELGGFNPSKSDFQLKMDLVEKYLRKGQLFPLDRRIATDPLFISFIDNQDASGRKSLQFIEENIGDEFVPEKDTSPLIVYLLEDGGGSPEKIDYLISHLSMDNRLALLQSPMGNQKIYDAIYKNANKTLVDRELVALLKKLSEIAEEFGYEEPQIADSDDYVDFPDDIAKQIILMTPIPALPRLSQTSSTFAKLLRSTSMLNDLAKENDILSSFTLKGLIDNYYQALDDMSELGSYYKVRNWMRKIVEADDTFNPPLSQRGVPQEIIDAVNSLNEKEIEALALYAFDNNIRAIIPHISKAMQGKEIETVEVSEKLLSYLAETKNYDALRIMLTDFVFQDVLSGRINQKIDGIFSFLHVVLIDDPKGLDILKTYENHRKRIVSTIPLLDGILRGNLDHVVTHGEQKFYNDLLAGEEYIYQGIEAIRTEDFFFFGQRDFGNVAIYMRYFNRDKAIDNVYAKMLSEKVLTYTRALQGIKPIVL
jgi:hypothetical protein